MGTKKKFFASECGSPAYFYPSVLFFVLFLFLFLRLFDRYRNLHNSALLYVGDEDGKIFVFKRVGAYSATEGMALFLSHELPKVLLYGRNMGWRLVRKEHQTYEYNMEKETEK